MRKIALALILFCTNRLFNILRELGVELELHILGPLTLPTGTPWIARTLTPSTTWFYMQGNKYLKPWTTTKSLTLNAAWKEPPKSKCAETWVFVPTPLVITCFCWGQGTLIYCTTPSNRSRFRLGRLLGILCQSSSIILPHCKVLRDIMDFDFRP